MSVNRFGFMVQKGLRELEKLQNQTARFTWGTVPCVQGTALSSGEFQPGGQNKTQEITITIRESVVAPNVIDFGDYVEIDRIDSETQVTITDAYTVSAVSLDPGGAKFNVDLVYTENQ